MNYFLILGPIGMIIIGLSAIILYKNKSKIKMSIFLLGGILWLIAVLLKSVIDLFLTPELYNTLFNFNQTLALVIISSIIGLRTGFFESGISYLYLKKKQKKLNWNQSLAIGIGFGGTEAIVLGLVNILTFIAAIIIVNNPALDATQRLLIESLFDQNTFDILFAWLERAFTILIHIFTTVLVVKAITTKDKNFLWLSIGFKTLIDLPIPLFQILIESGMELALYLVEAYIACMGLAAYYGLKWVKDKKKIKLLK